MVEDNEDSSLTERKQTRPGPSKAMVIGIPVLGTVVTLVLVAIVLWIWATARAFVVPQSAMAPAIFGGDEIHADATAYGLRLPLLGTFGSGYPHRGEVVVFEWPQDQNSIYVMRVIAVGGDQVQVHADGTIDVRGERLQRCEMGSWPKGRDPNGIADGRKACVEWNHDTPYVTLYGNDEDLEDPRCVAEPCTVPEDHLFVLGDNRTNSFDSRAWGFVPIDHVIGKVFDTRVPEDLDAYRNCIEKR